MPRRAACPNLEARQETHRRVARRRASLDWSTTLNKPTRSPCRPARRTTDRTNRQLFHLTKTLSFSVDCMPLARLSPKCKCACLARHDTCAKPFPPLQAQPLLGPPHFHHLNRCSTPALRLFQAFFHRERRRVHHSLVRLSDLIFISIGRQLLDARVEQVPPQRSRHRPGCRRSPEYYCDGQSPRWPPPDSHRRQTAPPPWPGPVPRA